MKSEQKFFKSLYHEALTTTKSSAPKLHDLYMKSTSLLKFLITIKQINKFSALFNEWLTSDATLCLQRFIDTATLFNF